MTTDTFTEAELIAHFRADKPFTFDIPNFHKWNPPTKHKRSWIKLDPHWHSEPRIRSLCPTHRLGWVVLLSLRGTSSEPIRNLSRTFLEPFMNLSGTSLEPLIVKLWKLKLIMILLERVEKVEGEIFKTSSPPPPTDSPNQENVLEGIDTGDFLSDVDPKAIETWCRVYGPALLRSEIRSIWAGWAANAQRQVGGNKALFINRWLSNAAKDAKQAKDRDRPAITREMIDTLWEGQVRPDRN